MNSNVISGIIVSVLRIIVAVYTINPDLKIIFGGACSKRMVSYNLKYSVHYFM